MNDRQTLEAILSVVCRYLPPNGISREQAISEIISLVDPLPEQPEQEPDGWGCKCSVCGEWQQWTPSGMVCKNGHGGADGINHRLYTAPPQQDEQKAFKTGYDAGVLETQLDQAKERNFCHRCGKRLMGALGPVSLHTCCPPAPTGWDNGLSQDYDKKLGAWFSEKPNAKEELRARTFDDYGNKII